MRRDDYVTEVVLGYAGGGQITSRPREHDLRPPSALDRHPHRRLRHVHDDELDRLARALRHRRPSHYERWIKPALDRLLAAALIVVLSPMLLLVASAVLIGMGRPVLFRQTRIGRGGAAFDMYKFRTMLPDRRVSGGAEYQGPERRSTHKSRHDPRHTALGRWMRRASMDELPQLFNVLRGEMSLVGPRPELVALTTGYAPWQRARHVVRPGVTGLWQTTERGNGQLLHECIDLDIRYIRDLSFAHDCAILLRTPFALLRNKGVI